MFRLVRLLAILAAVLGPQPATTDAVPVATTITAGIPGSWLAGVNLEAGANHSMVRFLDFGATGSAPWLKHQRFEASVDGALKMYGSSGRPLFHLDASSYYLQEDAPSPIRGINIMGDVPSGWDVAGGVYLNLKPGTGASLKFIRHDQFELRHTGSPLAIFRGLAQETDTNPHFKIDFPNKLLTLTDEGGALRLKMGKVSSDIRDYGLSIYDANAAEMLRIWGAGTPIIEMVAVGGFKINRTIGGTADFIQFLTGPGVAAFDVNSGGIYLGTIGSSETGADLYIRGRGANWKALYFGNESIKLADQSTNKADLAGIVVSTSSASGDYPEGTIWFRVPA